MMQRVVPDPSHFGIVPIPPLLKQDPSAPWALGRAGASGTISNLGPWLCESLEHHRHLGASNVREPRAASAPWCLDAFGRARASGTIGNLGPWSCESLGYHQYLGAWMCGSFGHHRHLSASDVQEPRAVLAPWCLDVREPRTP
ncbi:hypothetical protein GOBAR_AA30718 [Gossypium barbadense]|uniref:Uncharacterized protein n=1 Tax=Gossypium barbadense TaxID=3634 RepID=A0A2P5WFV1_GOSBA|nr:hypothetical protein GOBAR_AA30718 [Gossypium barbadense]